MKKISSIILSALMGGAVLTTTSCGDFLDQESDRVIYADNDHLNNASDTLYSVTGIMNKMQALADRTILLGELRGDLVDVLNNTSADLREISNFDISSDNPYNSPRDYYAVINNCNYFLAKADTALKNNRNEYVFRKEYAAVKAYRAWTYLQLALNYGKVPLVTTPVLTKDDADRNYDMYDIKGICEYFVNDIAPYAEVEVPAYGTIRGNDSRLFYFPIYVLMGDMNLWAGNYRQAALCYYKYISTSRGTNVALPVQKRAVTWMKGDSKWMSMSDSWSLASMGTSCEAYGTYDLITEIPGDSIPSEGNYSQLRNLFNSNNDNSYQVSLVPSQQMYDLSAAQKYCHINNTGDVIYAPSGLSHNKSGDLRLQSYFTDYSSMGLSMTVNGKKVENYVNNQKHSSQNVHIYRNTMVYMRLAEALNRAGFPRLAFAFLKTGVNNDVIEGLLEYYPDDEAFLKQFDFPTNRYILRTKGDNTDENTIGIHSHGCGWTEYNDYYVYPERESLAEEEDAVEDLIIDEDALEFSFEGTRFYDLMRVALRRNDPSYLANRVYARRGESKATEMKSVIKKNLLDTSSWYLNWNGKIGLGTTTQQ